jgi:hypothetical protein
MKDAELAVAITDVKSNDCTAGDDFASEFLKVFTG